MGTRELPRPHMHAYAFLRLCAYVWMRVSRARLAQSDEEHYEDIPIDVLY